ncbi:MAG TPA: hypothetical protein VGD61_02325 [Pyrinomonadaceae bacterium]
MNHLYLKPLTFVLLLFGVASLTPVCAGIRDNNLIEFSRGSYGNMSVRAMLWPPELKIYQDGKVIHYEGSDDRRFFVSQLEPQQLDTLKKFLAAEKYLCRSRFIEMPGAFINVHGGVSYIRYLDGDKEIILATEVKPKGGPWMQLIEKLWDYVPDDHEHVYYPASIVVQTSQTTSDACDPNAPEWPFKSKLRLNSKLKTISDPEIIQYLFDRLRGVFSFFVWDLKQDDKMYSVFFVNSSGWFEQDYLNKALTKVRDNGYRVQEQ